MAGPVSTTLDAALTDVSTTLGADFLPGQKHVLGTRVDFSQSSSDDVIGYVSVAAGTIYSGPNYSNLTLINTLVAASTIEAVVKPKDTGGQTWIYIQAGIDIDRGEAVMWDATAVDATSGLPVLSGILADEPGKVIGIAQWHIDSGDFGWILAYGVGKVLAGAAAITQGEQLIIDAAAGASTDIVATTDVAYGVALEAAAAAVLAYANIQAPA